MKQMLPYACAHGSHALDLGYQASVLQTFDFISVLGWTIELLLFCMCIDINHMLQRKCF